MSVVPLPTEDTVVTFPSGGLTGESSVRYVETRHDRTLVLTDSTPFHPVDPRWPDQGPDVGVLTVGGVDAPVLDCVIGASDGTALFVGDAVPVRPGERGWTFVVVHAIAVDGPQPTEGDRVDFTVDAANRRALSAGHTGCHVASLALNAALADRWRKPVHADALGRPNFDQQAIISSRILPGGSVDTYRLGKSLRKKGFDTNLLVEELPGIATRISGILTDWVASGAAVDIEFAGPKLTDRRNWVCFLPSGVARIPCGGTHVQSLSEFSRIDVQLSFDGAAELVMTTTVVR